MKLWTARPHLQQQVDDGRLLAGRGHAEVVHDQDPHEVEDVLFGRVVGERRLGAHVTVFRLAAVHTGVPGKGLELLCGRPRLVVQISDLERKAGEENLSRFYFKNRIMQDTHDTLLQGSIYI